MNIKGISVIIPTYNRSSLLNETLQSLTQQSCQRDIFEVIVCDDGSSDDTKEVVDSYKDRLDVTYLFQKDDGFRAAAARNLGINQSKYDICLFIDSGVIAHPDLVSLHLSHYQENVSDDCLIGLCFGFDEFDTKHEGLIETLYQHYNRDLTQLFSALGDYPEFKDCRYDYLKTSQGISESLYPWFIFWTCHVSAKTESLRQVSGFDEAFCRWGGEDFELGIRLQNIGCQFGLLPQHLVLHLPHEKDEKERKELAKLSLVYIREKHHTMEQRLFEMDWKTGLALTSVLSD